MESYNRKGMYDAEQVNSIGCYTGWFYARINATGEVMPCCGCYRKSMGNLNETDFMDIWRGKKYEEFRKRAIRTGNKISRYFARCYCYKTCHHLHDNKDVHEKLNRFYAKYPFLPRYQGTKYP